MEITWIILITKFDGYVLCKYKISVKRVRLNAMVLCGFIRRNFCIIS